MRQQRPGNGSTFCMAVVRSRWKCNFSRSLVQVASDADAPNSPSQQGERQSRPDLVPLIRKNDFGETRWIACVFQRCGPPLTIEVGHLCDGSGPVRDVGFWFHPHWISIPMHDLDGDTPGGLALELADAHGVCKIWNPSTKSHPRTKLHTTKPKRKKRLQRPLRDTSKTENGD